MESKNNRQIAVVYMLLSALSLCIMQIFVKLTAGKIPVMQQVFFRNFITIFVALYFVKKSKAKYLGSRENQPLLIGRSILGFLGVVMYFYATNNMIVTDATILHKSSPFFVTIFSCIFLKEKLNKVQVPCLLVAFLGAILVVKPQLNSSVFPAIIGLLSAVAAGGAYTLISYIRDREHPMTIVLHFSVLSSLLCIPFMIADFVIPSSEEMIMLLCIGIFAGIGQIMLTLSYRYAKASEVSIYNFSSIVFSGILGFVVFRELPDYLSIIGSGFVIAAALILFVYSKKEHVPEGVDSRTVIEGGK